jgi:hypothetical protein
MMEKTSAGFTGRAVTRTRTSPGAAHGSGAASQRNVDVGSAGLKLFMTTRCCVGGAMAVARGANDGGRGAARGRAAAFVARLRATQMTLDTRACLLPPGSRRQCECMRGGRPAHTQPRSPPCSSSAAPRTGRRRGGAASSSGSCAPAARAQRLQAAQLLSGLSGALLLRDAWRPRAGVR